MFAMWASGHYGYLLDYLLWWALVASLFAHAWCFFRFCPRSKHPRLFVVAGNGLVAMFLLGIVALGVESYLRFLSTTTDTFGATMTCKRWRAAYAPTNSLGHRDREWPESKPPGVRRFAFLGDSFVYGWGINDPGNRFPDIIQSRFDRFAPGTVQVLNLAWADWGTRDQAEHLEHFGDSYALDEVVLCYLPNDIQKLLPKPPGLDPTKPPSAAWVRTNSSFLLDYFYYRVYAPRLRASFDYFGWIADGFANESIWRLHQEELSRIIRWCRQRNLTVRAALLPFLRTSGTRYDPQQIHRQLADFFQHNGVPVVDLWPAVRSTPPAKLVVNSHDAHPNEAANAIFAEAIWNAFYAENKDR